MAIATTGNKIFRYGDDNNAVWPFPYPVPEPGDIKVIITPPGGVDQYVNANLFQVEGAGTNAVTVTYPLSGEPLPMGWKITILRELELSSDFDPDNGASLNAEEVAFELDRHLMMLQQQQEQLGRALILPASEETDFVRMVETVVTESRQVEEYYNIIKETAETFDSATETQRGAGYAATADEAGSFATGARDPAGPAFLTPETGKILTDAALAGVGLGAAAIDRLGAVRIAKQSEVTKGVTETGRSPAVIRPEELAVELATAYARADLSDALAGVSNKLITSKTLKGYVKVGTGYLQIGMILICFGRGAGVTAFAKAFSAIPQIISVNRSGYRSYEYGSGEDRTTYYERRIGSSHSTTLQITSSYGGAWVRGLSATASVGIAVTASAINPGTDFNAFDYIVIGTALEA